MSTRARVECGTRARDGPAERVPHGRGGSGGEEWALVTRGRQDGRRPAATPLWLSGPLAGGGGRAATAGAGAAATGAGTTVRVDPLADLGPGEAQATVGAAPARSGPVLPGAGASLEEVAARAVELGLRRVELVAWRDLDDPEAGGSELHAHRVASLWARSGLDVHLSTSAVPGMAARARRDGYGVERRSGRYAVFPRTVARNLLRREPGRDGLVEVWNGMPFLSPLWARTPRVVFLHHVHAEMWRMVLPPALAAAGDLVERRLAPPLYRGSRIVTLSASSRAEIVSMLGLPAERVSVVPPGVDPVFAPGGTKSAEPLVVAVGRLVPVKRFDLLVDALAAVRARHPGLRAVIVGEGYERERLQARVRSHDAAGWLTMPGHLDQAALVDLYRRAWALVSHSQREGWGMTITEAAACGTPAVATRIAGHADAVEDGRTGLLVDGTTSMVRALDALLRDPERRERLARGALERAGRFTWEATAAGTLQALADEAATRARARG